MLTRAIQQDARFALARPRLDLLLRVNGANLSDIETPEQGLGFGQRPRPKSGACSKTGGFVTQRRPPVLATRFQGLAVAPVLTRWDYASHAYLRRSVRRRVLRFSQVSEDAREYEYQEDNRIP